ncbi:hypothetical protein SLNSH_20455 [Alsobacter soli]|uniref:FAD-dependent urate hydroxylase HpyO/Asp monooxygenase CreE-like FAD/NAD(P)-binding domain-containing protein n=1 Tax=Alsobacter soli TaxID=2109933 RepID=A0A2T1HN86_9HYPH|nr:FAD/NAD(P)-binding protein [Alsobacter soli]PSC03106.1 hypothetical protein SLNSH_20455 [Alsobacter soli]
MRSDEMFDVVILGSGIACTLTLQALLGRLRQGSAQRRTLRIGVVEKNPQFWRGLPYGSRSSVNSLIITTLGEFVPPEERDEFVDWLEREHPQWSRRMAMLGGPAARAWLEHNAQAISARDWDEMYIPRVLYGEFAEAKLASMVTDCESQGLARVELINGEALAVRKGSRCFEVELDRAGAGRSQLASALILLAVGSPPYSRLAGSEAFESSGGVYVNNAYEPSLDANFARVRATMSGIAAGERNLLVVGSNATSLELLYLLERSKAWSEFDSVVVLSTGGSLPHRMSRDRFQAPPFPRLEALAGSASATADDVIAAAEQDVAEIGAEMRLGDTFHHLGQVIGTLLESLDDAEQRRFHHVHGMRFTRLIRRAGAEYRDAAEDLITRGIVRLTAGELVRLGATGGGRAELVYRPGRERGETTHPLSFAAVINCAGFEGVSAQSSHPLLADLVRSGLAQVNPTGRGVMVGPTYEASSNLFVCGPLLGGVFNEAARYWHVENVRRIHAIAQPLAGAMAERLLEAHAPAPEPA